MTSELVHIDTLSYQMATALYLFSRNMIPGVYMKPSVTSMRSFKLYHNYFTFYYKLNNMLKWVCTMVNTNNKGGCF